VALLAARAFVASLCLSHAFVLGPMLDPVSRQTPAQQPTLSRGVCLGAWSLLTASNIAVPPARGPSPDCQQLHQSCAQRLPARAVFSLLRHIASLVGLQGQGASLGACTHLFDLLHGARVRLQVGLWFRV
jgi:hypothetical protein